MVELAATKFSKRKDGKFALWRTEFLSELLVAVFEDAADTDFGDLRELGGRFFQGRNFGHFAQGKPHHLTAFPPTQRAKISARDQAAVANFEAQIFCHLRAIARCLANV